jgi:hypothetical protein
LGFSAVATSHPHQMNNVTVANFGTFVFSDLQHLNKRYLPQLGSEKYRLTTDP